MPEKKCQYCAMMIQQEARVCPYCGIDPVFSNISTVVGLIVLSIPAIIFLFILYKAYGK